jgi:hypothetical protein
MDFNRLDKITNILKQFKEGLLKMSRYEGYTDADNVKRKANNLGEETGLKSMPHMKQWSKRGVDTPDKEAKKLRAKSKKNPVKVITDPKEIEEKMKGAGRKTEEKDGKVTVLDTPEKTKSIYEK